MEVVNDPDATALPFAPGCPANFPNAARLRNHGSRFRVRGHECNQQQPFLLGEQASRLHKGKWRFDDRHRREFHRPYYTLKAHASRKALESLLFLAAVTSFRHAGAGSMPAGEFV